MKIPVQNIYYLLCYAWDKLDEKEAVDVNAQDFISLADLFAKVLINGTTYLFKKGLDRDYIDQEEETRRIRGKILFGPSIKRNLFSQCIAHCQFDDLSHDVLHNQILKATFRLLLNIQNLDSDLKNEVALLYKRFPNVSDIVLDGKHFQLVKLNKNNFFYDFLIHVCKIIFDSTLIDEKSGKAKFMDFIRDEAKMSHLFEAFVRNFYKKEQDFYKVGREYIHWYLSEPGKYDYFLPVMETDTSLTAKDGSSKTVIETKYKKNIFQSRISGKDKVISENLYQLYAYLKNLEPRGAPNTNCDGILLYASGDENAHVDMKFNFPEHQLRVKALNLSQEWQKISEDLKGMIGLSRALKPVLAKLK